MSEDRSVKFLPDDSPLRNPAYTTAHSRHAEMIAEALIKNGISHDCASDPTWAGESILSSVNGLWAAKAEIARLRLTDEEREAVEWLLRLVGGAADSVAHARITTLRSLLKRLK
jgi:hypothetical protein